MPRILVLNGPNLNLLGSREPVLYGGETLAALTRRLKQQAKRRGVKLVAFQSNAEHALINRVHKAKSDGTNGLLVNAGGFTHTSVALRDALKAVALPFVEVHLSNVYAREPFRHHSYLSDIAAGVIVGFGPQSYELGLEALLRLIEKP
jgi:3-dehydroquinate dehydratase-2